MSCAFQRRFGWPARGGDVAPALWMEKVVEWVWDRRHNRVQREAAREGARLRNERAAQGLQERWEEMRDADRRRRGRERDSSSGSGRGARRRL